MATSDAQSAEQNVVYPDCKSNPHKAPCCRHPEDTIASNGVVSRRQVCCWCGEGTTWKVILTPSHGPKVPKQYDAKMHAGKYP